MPAHQVPSFDAGAGLRALPFIKKQRCVFTIS